MKANTKTIMIRLPPDLANPLKRDAQRSYRSVNKHVIYLIRKRVKPSTRGEN
jgi:predicted HicB family RNase H-like nuclease